ncbi:hypothetical protein M9458_018796, partial [Cirrhinus mrigala]
PSAALAYQLPGVVDNASDPEKVLALVQGKHVLVPTDNTATMAYINHQGSVCSFRMSQLARHLLLWSQGSHSFCVPLTWSGVEAPPSDGLAGTSRSVRLTRIHSFPVVVWPDRGPPQYRSIGTQLTERVMQARLSPSEEDTEEILLLTLFQPNRTWFLELLSSIPPGHIPLRKNLLSQGKGTIWNPRPDLWNYHLWTPETFHPQCPLYQAPVRPGNGAGVLPKRRTHGDAASNLCYPSSKEAWIGTFLLLHLRSMWQLTMTWWKADR